MLTVAVPTLNERAERVDHLVRAVLALLRRVVPVEEHALLG